MSSSLVKIGTWGGAGGSARDITVAPQRLESVTIRWGKVIDWIAFSYLGGDGKPHTAGPWGGNGEGEGTETITLGPSEYVTEVAWSVGPFAFKNVDCCITSIKLVTNLGTYGPFGHAVDSTHHSLPVLNNGRVVGMFARAGDFLDAIGFYVLPCMDGSSGGAGGTKALPIVARTMEPSLSPSINFRKEEEEEEDEEKEKEGDRAPPKLRAKSVTAPVF